MTNPETLPRRNGERVNITGDLYVSCVDQGVYHMFLDPMPQYRFSHRYGLPCPYSRWGNAAEIRQDIAHYRAHGRFPRSEGQSYA